MNEIERKLDRLFVMTEAHVKRFEDLAEDRERWEDCTDRLLYGQNGNPGMVVRLDRLEQSGERGRWLSRALVGVVLALVAARAWELLVR